jgi:hypothetical protein
MNKYQWNMVVLDFVLIIILYFLFAFSNFYSSTRENDQNDFILDLASVGQQQDEIINENIARNRIVADRLDSLVGVEEGDREMLEVLAFNVSRSKKELTKKNAILEAKLLQLSEAFEKHLKLDSLK